MSGDVEQTLIWSGIVPGGGWGITCHTEGSTLQEALRLADGDYVTEVKVWRLFEPNDDGPGCIGVGI